jgi:hypothetical protein
MILEGLVTTLSLDGEMNVAPMGPRVEPTMARFVLRPYRTSTTYQNLRRHGEGVFHVTDDVLLLARAVIGLPAEASTRPADVVCGAILTGCCRYYEFRVLELDDHNDRTTILAETVAAGRIRDFFGFNRAKHAVIEAAILASRIDFHPLPEILAEFHKLAVPVEKTGGSGERQAFALLDHHVREAARARGLDSDGIQS